MTLRGHLDEASSRRLRGWAQDDEAPNIPVSLVVTVDDRPIGRVLANGPRDLAAIIRRLHKDEELNGQIADAGRDFVAGYASDEAIDDTRGKFQQKTSSKGQHRRRRLPDDALPHDR